MNRVTTNSYDGFEDRLKNIDVKRTVMARGYTGSVNRDGLIVFRPVRRKRAVTLRTIVMLIVSFFMFKGMVMAHTGASIYDERIAMLQSGTLIEQAGAFAMQSDPVTVGIARQMGRIFH